MFARLIASGMLVSVLALGSTGAWAQAATEGHSLEAVLAESADTPAEHKALASHYRAKAAEARATSAEHRSMAKHYSGKPALVEAGKKHCAQIADAADQQAAAYDSLAKAHDQAAAGQ